MRSDRGTVTVEAAIALGAFVVVLAIAFAGVAALLDQLRCTDAAREAARLTARGEQDRAADAVHQIAGAGATLVVHLNGDEIEADVRAPSVADVLPGVHIGSQAFAVKEPDVDDGGKTSFDGEGRK
ncbi:MAG: pilus assembly protein [Sciscionella sp.]|nr:pilus assembly protein [Sciscionella sp.]